MKDADVPEADALEQSQEWAKTDSDDSDDKPDPDIPIDVPEADALEQAKDVPIDEDEDYR